MCEKEKKTYQTGLRVPQNQYDRIHRIADKTGMPINSVILQAVDIGLAYIEKAGKGCVEN